MDKLFLLKPDFTDSKVDQEGKKYYCPYCAAIEGVLGYYPQLRSQLEVHYVDFPRPRQPIIDLIGEGNQGCPVLIIDANSADDNTHTFIKEANGNRFITSSDAIMTYLAAVYKISLPHP